MKVRNIQGAEDPVCIVGVKESHFVRQTTDIGGKGANQVVGSGQEVQIEQETFESFSGIAFGAAAGEVDKRVVVDDPVLGIS